MEKKIGCNAYKGTKLIWFESAYSDAVFLSDSIFDWALDWDLQRLNVESTFRSILSLIIIRLSHQIPFRIHHKWKLTAKEEEKKTGAEIIQISNEFLAI